MTDMALREAAIQAWQAGSSNPAAARRTAALFLDALERAGLTIARATSPAPEDGDPPSDLLDLAEELEDDDVEKVEWRDRRRYSRVLRAHRCRPV